jgi:hypothetical protein
MILRSPTVKPLDTVSATLDQSATAVIFDAAGREYHRQTGKEISFEASGALGTHVISVRNEQDVEIERDTFSVNCDSEITDEAGRYPRLLMYLQHAMLNCVYNPGNIRRVDGRAQESFVLTNRDHVHGMKAMKYFQSIIPSWTDTYADHQCEDGMIWDFCARRDKRFTHFENRWGEKFHKVTENGWTIFARQPIMNDVEYMFIHGVYWVWKTIGDDEWMKKRVNNALAALRYATSSPYTWSEKFQLVKRTFTIDLWDFQSKYDADLVAGDAMQGIPGVSQYGIMYGDNLGIAQGCDYIAEMLTVAGREEEAAEVEELGAGIRKRLDEISWNGEFFTMFIPEDPTFQRDFGVDTDTQVTLSNSYALNRGISHEQAKAIIHTYQRLRKETRDFAPAEWFCCYPPFEKGFGHHGKWHSVNGGVSPMVAGELAHGAFEHGFESYGWDIIDRVLQLGDQYDMVPRVWRGEIPDWPERTFTPLDLREVANTDFCGTVESDAIPWTREAENDFANMPVGRQILVGVEFDIINPAENDRKACVGISCSEPYRSSLELPLNQTAESIYFLHTCSGGDVVGNLTVLYADGTEVCQYIQKNKHLQGWWYAQDPPYSPGGGGEDSLRVAWSGSNSKSALIGVCAWGWNNPHPDKEIASLRFTPSIESNTIWLLLGVTLCDKPVFFMPTGLSGGIPDVWSCGAVVYALFEGLAGAYDEGTNYSNVRIAPRFAAGEDQGVIVCAKYEDTGSYIRYEWERRDKELTLHLAASTPQRRLEILLPPDRLAKAVRVDGENAAFATKTIEASQYVCLDVPGLKSRTITITLE